MKTRFLALVGGCCAPLLVTGPATASFTGITTESRSNAFGISVISVYAEFDQLGDRVTAIAGTPQSPLSISVIGGTFFQHVAGSDRAPLDTVVALFPSLAYDTFVTIGVNLLDLDGNDGGQTEDFMFTTPLWPGFGPSSLELIADAWAVLPFAAQGDPFNPAFVAGDGRTLIAQLATTDGTGFEGSVLVQYLSGGLPGATYASFTHIIPAPGTLALLGLILAGRSAGRGRSRAVACRSSRR